MKQFEHFIFGKPQHLHVSSLSSGYTVSLSLLLFHLPLNDHCLLPCREPTSHTKTNKQTNKNPFLQRKDPHSYKRPEDELS